MGSAANASIPELVALLDDGSAVWLHEVDPDPRRNTDERLSPAIVSSRALAQIGASSLPYLSDVIREGSPSSRKHAVDAVALIGGDEAMSILRSALASKDTVVKTAAAGAMYQMDDPRLRMLQKALRDPDPQVKRAAIESIQYICGDSNECEAMHNVSGCLKASDEKVRETAVRAIGFVFSSKASGQVEVDLLSMLHDRSPSVRSEAAFSLGLIRSWNAVRPLVRRLTDSNASVRGKARWALVNITGKDFGSGQYKWARWIAKSERTKP
jgi:HEAT repeat protein